jgi:hypothetical protein
MTDFEVRLRDDLADAAHGVPLAPAIPPELSRRVAQRRVRHRTGYTALTVTAVAASAALAVGYLGDRGRGDNTVVAGPPVASTGTPSVRPLATAPLSPRSAAAAAWTGSAFVVWGGAGGNQAASQTFADGASYDPTSDTWRALPPAPITGRAGAVAVWTGTEVVLWGGNDDTPGPDLPHDGAAFNPATRQWRPITEAPSGRAFARALYVAGRVVIVGGTTPTGAPTSALVYDPAQDLWREVPAVSNVVDATATNGEVVALSLDPASNALSLTAINPLRATTRRLPAPPITGRPERVGIAWDGTQLDAAVTVGAVTRLATLGVAEVWRLTAVPAADAFHPPVHVGFDPDTTPLVWTGDRLLSASERGIEAIDPNTGNVTTLLAAGAAPCGAGAAQAWTGSSLISWGGQTCRVGGPSEHATGVLLTPNGG